MANPTDQGPTTDLAAPIEKPQYGTPEYWMQQAQEKFGEAQRIKPTTPDEFKEKSIILNYNIGSARYFIEQHIRTLEEIGRLQFENDFGEDIAKAEARAAELIAEENARIRTLKNNAPLDGIDTMGEAEGKDDEIEKQRVPSDTLREKAYREVLGLTPQELSALFEEYIEVDEFAQNQAYRQAFGMGKDAFENLTNEIAEGYARSLFQRGQNLYTAAKSAQEDPSLITAKSLRELGFDNDAIQRALENPENLAFTLFAEASSELSFSRTIIRHTDSMDISDESIYPLKLGVTKSEYEAAVEETASEVAKYFMGKILEQHPDMFDNPDFVFEKDSDTGFYLSRIKTELNLAGIDTWSPAGLEAMGLDHNNPLHLENLGKLYQSIRNGPMPDPLPEGAIVPDDSYCIPLPDRNNTVSPHCSPEEAARQQQELQQKLQPALDRIFKPQ